MEGDITDTDTGQDIPQELLIESVMRYSRLIEVLLDMEAGAVTMTYTEYLKLPATFITARRIVRNTLSKMKKKQ